MDVFILPHIIQPAGLRSKGYSVLDFHFPFIFQQQQASIGKFTISNHFIALMWEKCCTWYHSIKNTDGHIKPFFFLNRNQTFFYVTLSPEGKLFLTSPSKTLPVSFSFSSRPCGTHLQPCDGMVLDWRCWRCGGLSAFPSAVYSVSALEDEP